MEGAICSYGSMASFPMKLWPIERDRPGISQAHETLTGAVFWSLMILILLGLKCFKTMGGKSYDLNHAIFLIGLCPKSVNPNCGILGILVFSMVFPRFSNQAIHPGQASSLTNSPKSRNFQEVFKHFDENGDQKLNAQEMLAFDSWSSGHFFVRDHPLVLEDVEW